jgi:DNA repair photolyase
MNTTKDFIMRKTLIYKTDVEYGDYTINHVQGCSHGCNFPCYAMLMARRFGKVKTYKEWCKPKIVKNALELLDKEIPKYKNKAQSIHLCFSTDPFMYGYSEIAKMSIEIIQKLNAEDIKCTVLTKGILPKALAKFSNENEYGITLVSLDNDFHRNMEPFSAPYAKRIAALEYLHNEGCKTWVSIEPYPTPNFIEQDFAAILKAISFVDKIVFGKLNYNSKISEYKEAKTFFNELSQQVIKFCNQKNKQYHIKNGTMI